MRNERILQLVFALFAWFTFHPALAEVNVYSAPDGIKPSGQFKIELIQEDTVYESFVYVTEAQLPLFNLSETTSFSYFDFTGKVKVRVTKLEGEFSSVSILPSSYGIRAVREGKSVVFELDRPRKVAVEFDNDITHPLLIFADAPDTEIPSADDPDVIFFPPGIHNPEKAIEPKAGQTIYIAPGAIVNAMIRGVNTPGVTICGRGILCGRFLGHTGGRHILFTGEGSTDIEVRDIIILDSPGFYVTTSGARTHVRNIKGIGWWFNTDGIACGPDGLIEDCFLKCNDDAIKLYHSGTRVYRTTIWQMENGAPFQISWNMPTDNTGFEVKDCDVIHCDHMWDNTNTAVFDAIHGGSGHMSNYLFEDIRIENCDWRLVSIQIMPNKFSKSKTLGKISNVTFRNICINTPDGKPMKRVNLLQGYDEKSTVSDFVFENLLINGHPVSDAKMGRFEIDPRTTSNISFRITDSAKAQPVKGAESKPDGKVFEWVNPIKNGLNSYGQMHFHIYPEKGIYYLVATEHPNLEWGKRGIILYTSRDLKNWREECYLINRNTVDPDAWYKDVWSAPEICRIKGKYYLIFSCRNDRLRPYDRLGLGIAVADEICGPYKVLTEDKPLAYGTNANMFEDKDGKVFLYWDRDGRFWGAEFNPENAAFVSEPGEIIGPSSMQSFRFLDSPFLMRHKETYYMLSSSFYAGYVIRIRYFTSDHPLGPWTLHEDPLQVWDEDEADMKLKMPWSASHPFPPPTQVIFQNQIFVGPGGKLYTAYHSSEKYSEPYLVIEPVAFDEKGVLRFPESKESYHKVTLK